MHVRDFRLLSYFIAIAESGSIRAAARQLSVSAPVVSKALQDLEENLGVTVARRGTRSIELTEDGRQILDHARGMEAAAKQAMAVGDSEREPRGTVRVTLPTELAVAWLPPILQTFKQSFPMVETYIQADDAVLDLRASQNDVGIRATFAQVPSATDDILANEPLIIVASPELANLDRLLPEIMTDVPLIAFGHLTGMTRLQALHRNTKSTVYLPLVSGFSVNNGVIAKELAKLKLGATLVVENAVSNELSSGQLINLSKDYEIGVVTVRMELRDSMPSAATQAFASHVRSWCRSTLH